VPACLPKRIRNMEYHSFHNRKKNNFAIVHKLSLRDLLRLRDCLRLIEAFGIKQEISSERIQSIIEAINERR
jgi:hypothetical protein